MELARVIPGHTGDFVPVIHILVRLMEIVEIDHSRITIILACYDISTSKKKWPKSSNYLAIWVFPLH
jgi:hypothetical protein